MLERFHKGKRFKDAILVIKRRTTDATLVIVPHKHRDSYKNGEKTMTASRRKGEETWPIHAHLLRKSRRYKPDRVIIYLVDTDDFWLSNYDDWFDPHKRITRRSKYGGEEIFHLPSGNMKHIPNYDSLRSL